LNCNRKHFSMKCSAKVKVKVKVTLRLAVYRQSVHLGVKPLENHYQTFFFSWTPAVIVLM
jgi:hypothetical protein